MEGKDSTIQSTASQKQVQNDQQYASFEELQRLAESPFENNTNVNITVPLGDTAFLKCKVRNLGERSVSPIYFNS